MPKAEYHLDLEILPEGVYPQAGWSSPEAPELILIAAPSRPTVESSGIVRMTVSVEPGQVYVRAVDPANGYSAWVGGIPVSEPPLGLGLGVALAVVLALAWWRGKRARG